MDPLKQSMDNPMDPRTPLKSLQNGAILLLVVAGALLGIALLDGGGPEAPKKDKHPVRPAAYYSLVFHTHKMGAAVYQASGDGKNCPLQGCRPDPQPLKAWMGESVALATQLAQAPQISDQCRNSANETQKKLVVLQSNLRKDTPYKSGYQAWKDINALLLTCD